MIKVITPILLSSVFLNSSYALADSPKLSSAIKIISTGEAMHKKVVSKIIISPSLAKLKKSNNELENC